jgi:adenosylcobinamide-GDP ribazoletransferase
MGAICLVAAAVIALLWYDRMSKSKFGGITGDLAGWFLQMCELLMAGMIVVGDVLWF